MILSKGRKSHIFHLIWKKTFRFWTFFLSIFGFSYLDLEKIFSLTEKFFKLWSLKSFFSVCDDKFFFEKIYLFF
jgi:hypothetical protein